VLEIRLLGTPEFAFEGAAFRFAAPPRTLPLLAWLLLHRRAPLARDAVAFAFWPDSAEEDARSDLRRHLYYLTKALPARNGEPWLVTDKKTIAWNARAACAFDVADFERLAADAATFEDAVRLYRGPLLEGVDDEWIEPERERLQKLAETALQALIVRERERDPARALRFAQQLLRVDPWREDAVRDAIELRHRGGDRAGALREYRDFAARLRRELDVAPMPETTAVYESIANSADPVPVRTAPAAPPAARITNLPARSAPLIGRDAALADVRALLESTRVATLAGTGGVGKTRLAIEAAWEALPLFPGGVWFADCGPLGDASLAVTAVAAAVGLGQATERPELATIVAVLRARKLLLVLDNCEHVVAEAARIATELLAGCPDVAVLATSREPLGVRGERVYRVPSLDVPAAFEPHTLTGARTHGAVALFEARASAADPGFALDASNVADVIEICRRLDGIALAIELAAARVPLLAPHELAQRLEERFRVLTGGERTALPRQRTMRALIDWSWDLCGAAERTLLRRLSIFPGTWTLPAAETICFDAALDSADAVALSGALVEKSLLVADRAPDGRRYRLLESIRRYAREKLAAAGEEAELAARHAAYYAAFGARVDREYEEASDARWYALATSELDNVRAALAWALGTGAEPALGAALASAYGTVWQYGTSRADRRWLDLAYERMDRSADGALTVRLLWQIAAISRADGQHAQWVAVAVRDRGDARTRGEALCWLADVHRRAGRFDAAADSLAEAEGFLDPVARPKAYATWWLAKGKLAAARGDFAGADAAFERALATATAAGATGIVVATRVALAEAMFAANDVAGALACATEAREAIREFFGRTPALADVTANIAAYELAGGRLEEALHDAREALDAARELDVPERLVAVLETVAAVAALRGEHERAAFLLGFADAERARRGLAPGPTEANVRARLRAALEGAGAGAHPEARGRGAIAGFERALVAAFGAGGE
jgi:predicted ATPase/DNA-binding SARP family transcriptional activator